jgi:hypothetical protein
MSPLLSDERARRPLAFARYDGCALVLSVATTVGCPLVGDLFFSDVPVTGTKRKGTRERRWHGVKHWEEFWGKGVESNCKPQFARVRSVLFP